MRRFTGGLAIPVWAGLVGVVASCDGGSPSPGAAQSQDPAFLGAGPSHGRGRGHGDGRGPHCGGGGRTNDGGGGASGGAGAGGMSGPGGSGAGGLPSSGGSAGTAADGGVDSAGGAGGGSVDAGTGGAPSFVCRTFGFLSCSNSNGSADNCLRAGCIPTTTCSGAFFPCTGLATPQQCATNLLCRYNDTLQRCEGVNGETQCSDITPTVQGTCRGYLGCGVQVTCNGSLPPCSTLTPELCTTVVGCQLVAAP